MRVFFARKQVGYNLIAIFTLVLLVLLFKFRQVIYLEYYSTFYVHSDAKIKQNQRDFSQRRLTYKPKCDCREQVVMLETNDIYYLVSYYNKSTVVNENADRVLMYHIPVDIFESSVFLCDMYNSLRRGPNSKVLSYSLYGKNRFYYDTIIDLAYLAKKLYPDWIIRINYDESIDKSIICEIECLKQKNEPYDYLDNVDFCNIESLPYDTSKTWSAKYMHGMSWRWLPIGDSFVDFVGSRDTDAWISERELDSVNVWMNSSTVFHIMRDHPFHDIPIVGGYWGFANVRDRKLASYLFKVLTNEYIAHFYNQDLRSPKGHDQFLLTKFFSPYSLKNSTTHDSFSCQRINGDPWPTKRPKFNCFVGCSMCCDRIPDSENFVYNEICPVECRPKDHQDWVHC